MKQVLYGIKDMHMGTPEKMVQVIKDGKFVKKKKVIVITVSRNFMHGHPRKGDATGFVEKITNILHSVGNIPDDADYIKIHTIRAGEYWRKVVDKVNAGTHVLSLRYWSGLPYKSKMVEFMELSSLGYQEIEIDVRGQKPIVNIDGIERISSILTTFAKNDGLSRDDFNAWFKIAYIYHTSLGQWVTGYRKPPYMFKGGIIHFTDFRY